MPDFCVLKRRAEFLAAAQSGRKFVANGLIMQLLPAPKNPDIKPPLRYGLTASGKIGNAVTRNRARRRLRALAREILPQHAMAGDYVLIARNTTAERDYGELRKDMVAGLKRLGAWREA